MRQHHENQTYRRSVHVAPGLRPRGRSTAGPGSTWGFGGYRFGGRWRAPFAGAEGSGKPFDKQTRLDELRKQQIEIDAELDLNTGDLTAVDEPAQAEAAVAA